ncbi:MAG: TM2 domain-containing protein [Alphaproteobacteria bacterium]|jgi:TM2 domain-containing membrane protein YozV|nr:TM2 domain-containing protein [Alphaproteobacteria bacterium]
MKTENKSILLNMWKNKLSNTDLVRLSQDLDTVNDEKLENLMLLPLKNPILTFLLSIFLGIFAVDRFYLGDISRGLIKLFCFLGIFVIFLAMAVVGMNAAMAENPESFNLVFFIVIIFALYFIVLVWYFLDLYFTFKKAKKINFNTINKAIQE